MKACPGCGRLFPEAAGFCPQCGVALLPEAEVPVLAAPDDPRIGEVLAGRYHVRRVVAEGGMGRVYEALDRELQRSVAVKVLLARVAADPVQIERFRREFQVGSEVRHPHVVEVYDFLELGEETYALVMEFLFGEELRAVLKRERVVAPARLVRLLAQAAQGLDSAHARGWVHRDLKPDNLFLCQTPEGDQTRILDFGSVKQRDSTKLTLLGTTIGSPYYMAPEQARGDENLDHRADVWALAALSYECLTGTVPFRGPTGPAILLKILTTEPTPPSALAPLPAAVDAALARGMRKVAGERTPTAGALADDLGHALGLTGAHAEWALIPERELASRIDDAAAAATPRPAAAALDEPAAELRVARSGPAGVALTPATSQPLVLVLVAIVVALVLVAGGLLMALLR